MLSDLASRFGAAAHRNAIHHGQTGVEASTAGDLRQILGQCDWFVLGATVIINGQLYGLARSMASYTSSCDRCFITCCHMHRLLFGQTVSYIQIIHNRLDSTNSIITTIKYLDYSYKRYAKRMARSRSSPDSYGAGAPILYAEPIYGPVWMLIMQNVNYYYADSLTNFWNHFLLACIQSCDTTTARQNELFYFLFVYFLCFIFILDREWE